MIVACEVRASEASVGGSAVSWMWSLPAWQGLCRLCLDRRWAVSRGRTSAQGPRADVTLLSRKPEGPIWLAVAKKMLYDVVESCQAGRSQELSVNHTRRELMGEISMSCCPRQRVSRKCALSSLEQRGNGCNLKGPGAGGGRGLGGTKG